MIKLHDLCHRGHVGWEKTGLAELCSVSDISKTNAHLFSLPCWPCAVSIMQMLQHLCVSSFSSGSGHFSCEVISCPPVLQTPPFCRWLLQELGTNYRGARAIYCHLLFFFWGGGAWKWKAISSFSLKLGKAHYEHLGRDCKTFGWWGSQNGFSVARIYFTCVKCHRYLLFFHLFTFL